MYLNNGNFMVIHCITPHSFQLDHMKMKQFQNQKQKFCCIKFALKLAAEAKSVCLQLQLIYIQSKKILFNESCLSICTRSTLFYHKNRGIFRLD